MILSYRGRPLSRRIPDPSYLGGVTPIRPLTPGPPPSGHPQCLDPIRSLPSPGTLPLTDPNSGTQGCGGFVFILIPLSWGFWFLPWIVSSRGARPPQGPTPTGPVQIPLRPPRPGSLPNLYGLPSEGSPSPLSVTSVHSRPPRDPPLLLTLNLLLERSLFPPPPSSSPPSPSSSHE